MAFSYLNGVCSIGCIFKKMSINRINSSTGTFDSMRFLGILNFKGVLPEFCIDIDISFYEYFTEVLCVAVNKISIKYFDILKNK